jgi:hypothetical protein
MVLEILRRLEARSETHLHKELLWDIKRVAGKVQIFCGGQYRGWYQYVLR